MGIIDRIKDKISNQVTPVPSLKVTMMGPRAVGKTSVMASIFSDTRDEVAGTQLYFRPNAETAKDLNKKRLQLMYIIEQRKEITDIPQTGAIAASNTETVFTFEMGRKGRQKTVEVEIKDFPGEYLISNPQKVSQFVNESHVIMIAIDTPYLMEMDGKYNQQKNDVTGVTSFLKENESAIKDKLVLFVPLKSERYFHDSRIEKVTNEICRTYAELIDFCKRSNIACAVVPIQTLGDVEFDKFVDNDMGIGIIEKLSRFRFYGETPKYQPMFCVQPLYYLMTYVANHYEWISMQPKNIWERMKNSFASYLKNDDEFFHEIKKMAQKIVYDKKGYSVIVNNSILKIK